MCVCVVKLYSFNCSGVQRVSVAVVVRTRQDRKTRRFIYKIVRMCVCVLDRWWPRAMLYAFSFGISCPALYNEIVFFLQSYKTTATHKRERSDKVRVPRAGRV